MRPELSPEELAAIGAMSDGEVADPWEFDAPSAPVTAGQMASPDAPIRVPPAPPEPANAKAAFSATQSQNEAFGKEVPRRDVDAEIAKLGQLRSGVQRGAPAASTSSPDFSARDSQARNAFVWNWLTGGPEQAYKFQDAYSRKRAEAAQAFEAERAKDASTSRNNAPISDAQAQMLVRTYGMTPEAVANMTGEDWARVEPVLKSAPYANNQAESRDQKTAIDMMKVIAGELGNREDNSANFAQTQLRGQNAVNTVKANRRPVGGGTGAGAGDGHPRDITDVLVTMTGARPDEVASALSAIARGELPVDNRQAQLMASARSLQEATEPEFRKIRVHALNSGVESRFNREHLTGEQIKAQQRDPGDRVKLKTQFDQLYGQLRNASKAFKRLKANGSINRLVQVPYGQWNLAIDSMNNGQDQSDARAIAAFLNPEMRKQSGAAMSEFEKDMGFLQFGVSAKANPFKSPDAMESWLRSAGDQMSRTSQTIESNYPGLMSGKQ